MKVALLKSRLFFRGGLEKYTRELASHFAKNRCTVTILTSGDKTPLPYAQVVSLTPGSKFSLWHLLSYNWASKRWLKKNPQAIIFGMERTTFQTHYRLGSGVHKVYLQRRFATESLFKKWTLYLNPLQLLILYYEKKALESPHLKTLFCNSEMVKNEVVENYALSPEKIQVVHNGVEWQKLEIPFLEGIKNPPGKRYQLLFVGNGYRRKGLQYLLEALPLLSFDYHLSIVGKEKNLPRFQKLAAELGIDKKLSFYGPQEDLIPFYQKAEALVLPTLYDPFANVTLEALAMGLYVVTSSFNGGKEVLTDSTGTVIKNLLDRKSLVEALEKGYHFRKTATSAVFIRNSVKELDFSLQLDKIVAKTLC